MVLVFTSSEGRYLSDSVVDSHEASVLRELGDDFTRAYPLGLMCLLTVKFCQPNHEFTFIVDMSFILYPLVLTPLV
jgi:hypothetical protein